MWSDGGCSSLLSIRHARLILAFISYADALACFPHSSILFWGVLWGTTLHKAAECMTWASQITHTDVQFGSHRLHLLGSCEGSSCMWSHRKSRWVRQLHPSYCQNILKQGCSLGFHDALNRRFKTEMQAILTTKHREHGSLLKRRPAPFVDLKLILSLNNSLYFQVITHW